MKFIIAAVLAVAATASPAAPAASRQQSSGPSAPSSQSHSSHQSSSHHSSSQQSSHHSSSQHSSHSHSHQSSSSHKSITVTHSSSRGHIQKQQTSGRSASGTHFGLSDFSFLDSPDHMAEAERKRQEFLSEQVRLARNRALKTKAYFRARDVAAEKHKWTLEFYSRMQKAKSFHAAMKSLHTKKLAHELAMQVKRRTAFKAWMIARSTNDRARKARDAATSAYAAAVKAFELARDTMGSGKKTLADAWAHYRSTLKIRVAAREEYVKWGKAHRAAIKGREAAGLKAAEAHQAYMVAHKKHSVSVEVHIAAVKRRAAARAAAIRAHRAVKKHAMSGFMYLAQEN